MEPTLDVGDRVLVNKLSYKLHDVHRGDVVVFERPPGASTGEDGEIKDLIKRVIAVGGDTIEAKEGDVYVNGERIDENYLEPGTPTDNLPAQDDPRRPRVRDGGQPHQQRGQPDLRSDRRGRHRRPRLHPSPADHGYRLVVSRIRPVTLEAER